MQLLNCALQDSRSEAHWTCVTGRGWRQVTLLFIRSILFIFGDASMEQALCLERGIPIPLDEDLSPEANSG